MAFIRRAAPLSYGTVCYTIFFVTFLYLIGWLTGLVAPACRLTPALTVGHALFASAMTAYILIAIRYEERDLAAALGEPYRRWRAATPLFVPRARTPRGRVPAKAGEVS